MTATAGKRFAETLGRYETSQGAREIVAICHHGEDRNVLVDRLVDRPVDGAGRTYCIGSDLQAGDIEALIADYRKQAADLDLCPMSRAAIEAKLDRGFQRRHEAIA